MVCWSVLGGEPVRCVEPSAGARIRKRGATALAHAVEDLAIADGVVYWLRSIDGDGDGPADVELLGAAL